MPAPVYATLGNADRDESQEAIDLNIVDSSGKHVDVGGGSSTPGASSITTAMLQDGAVTDDKIASGTINADKLAPGVIPTAATTSVTGLVKQATHVADPAGEAPTKAEFIALRDALVAAGQMASA